MSDGSAKSSIQGYDTLYTRDGAPRLAVRISKDINWLSLQHSDEIYGGSFGPRLIAHELEDEYRQKWKLE